MDIKEEMEAFEQHLIDTGLVEFAGYGFELNECGEYLHEPTLVALECWLIGLNRAQAVPEWNSVDDKEPPLGTMVLICWSDAPDVEPEKDYMDHDVDHGVNYWANYNDGDEPSHWMLLPKPVAQEQK